jgi:diguanylate cyclase (GGDEF)-like protein
MRDLDFVARYGGEEFAVLFRDTDRTAAAVRVELLRAQIAGVPLRVTDTKDISVTCSAGIAELRADGIDPVVLLARADSRLLAAKRGGRDRAYATEAEFAE